MDKRDADGFEEFVAARSNALLRTACLLVADVEAGQDLLQDALERAYRRWPRVVRDGAPEAYVRRVLLTLTIDRWRRRRRWLNSSLAAVELVASEPVDVELRDSVLTALRALPPRERAVVTLRYWDQLSTAETASALGCAEGTVRSLASRGLARLRHTLTPSGDAVMTSEVSDGA